MKKMMLVALSVAGLGGCLPFPKPVDPVEPNLKPKKTAGIYRDDAGTAIYTPPPTPNYFYGQLRIETTFPTTYSSGEQGAIERLARNIFGQEVQQFGVTVTPILNDVKLPPVVIFNYKRDAGSNSWQLSTEDKYESPSVLVRASTQLKYEINYVASNRTDVSIAQNIASATKAFTSVQPGAWIISELSKDLVDRAVATIDSSISKTITKTSNVTKISFLQPAKDGSRQYVYNIQGEQGLAGGDDENGIIARITIYSYLSPSFIAAQVDSKGEKPPIMTPDINPLNSLTVQGGQSSRLWDSASNEASYINMQQMAKLTGKIDESQVSAFELYCIDLKRLLRDKYSLSHYDSISAMSYMLKYTQYTKSRDLYGSTCLSVQDKKELTDMGIPMVSRFPEL